MDLLNRSRAPQVGVQRLRRHLPWLAVLSLWLVVAACWSFPSRRSEPSFPHRVHVVDNQLACSFCHGGVLTSDHASLPPPELCGPCHERFDGDKPPERRLRAFFDAESRYRRVAPAGPGGEVRFSHRQHATAAGLQCTSCHADIAEQDAVPLQPIGQKTLCMDCHREHGQSLACATCHTTIDATWRPKSHSGQWQKRHGACANGQSERSEDRCELCHQDATGCNACHQQMAPDDHTQTFRVRSHGLMASIDRTRCQVCHTQDSCQQCHESTRPTSHRAGWGTSQQRHCVGCHLPLADTGCAVCHQDAPSHQLATPLPGDHHPGMSCRLCHGNGVRLPHPDGGHSCTACHR